MKKLKNRLKIFFPVFLLPVFVLAQKGQLHGNFQTDVYYYNKDTLIGAGQPPQKIGFMGYANFIYEYQNFTAGLRYEAYLLTPEGYDKRYNGTGIPYKFLQYQTDLYKVVVGSFYEQFGSGLILRSYEDKTLGIDNSYDGILVHINPAKGLLLKGLIGKQRFFWSEGPGIVRGADAELNLSEYIKLLQKTGLNISIGGSAVSKYEDDKDPLYKLPKNVLATSGRTTVSYKNIIFQSEYAYKINDPSADNNFIYQDGQALKFSTTYTRKGFGVILQAQSLYNMSFRSSRNANLNNLAINYIPALSKNHSYALTAMYPYVSQPNGETGFEADIFYKIPKKTKIGGKYGTSVSVNFSRISSIKKLPVADTINIGQAGTLGYNADLFSIGKELYYQDFSLEIYRKISHHLKMNLEYQNLIYNYNVLRGKKGHPTVFANVGVADITYKINSNNTIKTQLQSLFTCQDYGNWAMALFQYTLKRKWFIAIMDQYNYGNEIPEKRIHYYNLSLGYTAGATRIQMGYGKQREGIMCVGGVCRVVPAMSGLTLSISSSF